MILKGRTALVTGSVGGLGRAMAEALAGAGASVMLHGLEDPSPALENAMATLSTAHDVRMAYRKADLSNVAQVETLIAETDSALGGVDILVNNAVVRHFSAIETFPLERWHDALAVNLTAAFCAIRLTLPGMRQRGYGRIVNMTSVYGSRGVSGRVDYVTTKTALQGLTRAVAAELPDGRVTCHALCPGAVLTPASEKRLQDLMQSRGISREAAEWAFLEGKQPNRRFVALESVTAALLLLCGPAGKDMNGAILPIEGGWLAT